MDWSCWCLCCSGLISNVATREIIKVFCNAVCSEEKCVVGFFILELKTGYVF